MTLILTTLPLMTKVEGSYQAKLSMRAERSQQNEPLHNIIVYHWFYRCFSSLSLSLTFVFVFVFSCSQCLDDWMRIIFCNIMALQIKVQEQHPLAEGQRFLKPKRSLFSKGGSAYSEYCSLQRTSPLLAAPYTANKHCSILPPFSPTNVCPPTVIEQNFSLN